MNKTTVIGTRLGALGIIGMLCTGCPNPQTYGTPRTTPAGKIQHSVAAEGWGFSGTDGQTDRDIGATYPTAPTYTLRVGLADSLDIGARISNLTSIGADVKWNFIKSDSFDMAIDPSFQFFHIGVSSGTEDASINVLYLNGPLMFGINVGDSVSIVPTLGVTWGWASASVASTDESDSASQTTGLMLRPGLGFDFRISERFALHPEITFLKTLDSPDGDSILMYMFGIGFNFGNLPKYGSGANEVAQ
ncbi:MAG TPA: hypothetical protein VJN18_23620 [Polyangiaceae bacterium]|nr:hypothetical protein [Polyangiaceae bacterium]